MKLYYIIKHFKDVIVSKLDYITYPLFIVIVLMGVASDLSIFREHKEFEKIILVQKGAIDILAKQTVDKEKYNTELKTIISEKELKIIELSKEVSYKNVIIGELNSKLNRHKYDKGSLDKLNKPKRNRYLRTVNVNYKLKRGNNLSTKPKQIYRNCDESAFKNKYYKYIYYKR